MCAACLVITMVAAIYQGVQIERDCGAFYDSLACEQGQPTKTGEMGIREVLGLFEDANLCKQVRNGLQRGLALDVSRPHKNAGGHFECELMRNGTDTSCDFVDHSHGDYECFC